ncbi:cytochrome P450 1A5, partial [Aplysia californica]|uniref:unspecific monooxygenase n=1 Tax=Aplysia californica TaxID=6500 RepID=A0ABM1ABM2_APLCA
MVEDSTADDHESAILCSLRHLLPDFLSWEAPSSSTLTNSLASSLSSLSSIHLLVLALGILVPVSVRSWCKTRDRKNLPGPWSFPVFGHVTSLCSTPHLTLTHLHRQYGDIYKVKVGRYEVVVVGGMEGVREGLVERASTLSARPAFQNFAHLYDEEEGRHRGLCTADNTEKHVVRKAFLTASIDAYCSDTRHIEDKLGSEIIDTVSRLIDKEGDIDPHEPLKAACLNIIFRLVFNQQFDPQGGLMRETLTTLDNRVDMLAVNPIDLCPLWKLFNTDEHASLVQNRSAIQLELQNKFINLHKDSYDREHIRDMADHLLLFVENADDFGLLTKEE